MENRVKSALFLEMHSDPCSTASCRPSQSVSIFPVESGLVPNNSFKPTPLRGAA